MLILYNVCNSMISLIYHPGVYVIMRSTILHRAGKAAIDVDNYEYNMLVWNAGYTNMQSMMSVLVHAD